MVGWLESIVLGIVQGLTEFLPISSSGHLVVVPAMFGWEKPALTFDLVLHLGTLVAVVVSFRRELGALALGAVGRGPDPRRARRMIGLLAIGTVPAGVAGLAFSDFFEARFEDPIATSFQLLITAALLLTAEWVIRRGEGRAPVDAGRAGLIGLAQAAAILPGISRSGSTIAMGLVTRVSRDEATRFSFLLSIPAIAGAVVSQIPDVADGSFAITGPVVAGFVAAAAAGWLSIGWLLRYVRTHSFVPFAVYLIIAAPIAALIIEVR